jgi:hypothetical protein
MELPITTLMLALLLVAVAVAFFIMPKFAPATLMTTAGIVLAFALYSHWSQFGVDQYERATWTNNVKAYGGYLIVGVVLLGAYGFYVMNNVSGGSDPMPAISSPLSGGGFGVIAKTVSSRIKELVKKGRISLD